MDEQNYVILISKVNERERILANIFFSWICISFKIKM